MCWQNTDIPNVFLLMAVSEPANAFCDLKASDSVTYAKKLLFPFLNIYAGHKFYFL